ncbi:hypothetical protein E4U23_001946 [Claviceps purpurea]|nr:hypothetical protein E4U23_001946 [Claviceps purpurea]
MPFASQTIRPRRPPVALQAKIVAGHGGQTVTCMKIHWGHCTVDGIKTHLLFRPMVSDDWDIIFPANLTLINEGKGDEIARVNLRKRAQTGSLQ